jgi:hypothetical protein
VVPTLKISGATTGKASFHAGADFVTGLAPAWDMSIAPDVGASINDGGTSIFSLSPDGTVSGAPTWQVGLTVSFLKWVIEEGNPSADLAALKHAYDQCKAACADQANPDHDAKWCKDQENGPPVHGPVDVTELCPRVKARVQAEDARRRAELGKFPHLVISLGASYAANQFKYLDSDGTPNPTLTPAKVTKSDARGGAALTLVAPRLPITFELPLLAGSKWTSQTTTAKWCVPAGNVSVKVNGVTQMVPGQSCDEQPKGAPTQVGEFWTAALFGYIDKPDGRFRLSIGPTFAYRFAGTASGQIRFGGTAPIYFNLGALGKEYTGDYKALVRVLPTVELVHDSTGDAAQATVAIQLLGARTLLGRALDWP